MTRGGEVGQDGMIGAPIVREDEETGKEAHRLGLDHGTSDDAR